MNLTATRPTATEFERLPLLRTDTLPEVVAESPRFASVAKRHRELIDTATTAVREFQEARAAITESHAADVESEVEALVTGSKAAKPTEAAAVEKAEKAHRAALAATLAANRVREDIRAKIKGDEGAEVQADANAEAASLARTLDEQLDKVAETVRLIAQQQRVAEFVDRARKPERALPTIRRDLLPVTIHNQQVPVPHLLESLRQIGRPVDVD